MLLYPSLVILLVSAAAAQNADFGESGSLSIGDYNTPQAEQVYLNAYNNPNASQSVTFQAPGTSAGSWTWRVTVAEINIPDNHQDLGLPSANYSLHERITNTQWHLEWSLKNNSNVTLQALLGESNVDLYINAIQATFSKSALSQYSQQSNGDCTALLGSQCLQAIQVAAVENFNGGSVGNVDIQNLANCSDAFRRAGASDFSFSASLWPLRGTSRGVSLSWRHADPFLRRHRPVQFDVVQKRLGHAFLLGRTAVLLRHAILHGRQYDALQPSSQRSEHSCSQLPPELDLI